MLIFSSFGDISTSQIYQQINLIGKIFLRATFIMDHHKSHTNLHTKNFKYVTYFPSNPSFLVYVGFHFITSCFCVVTNRILQGLCNTIWIFISYFNGTNHFLGSQPCRYLYPLKNDFEVFGAHAVTVTTRCILYNSNALVHLR